MEPPADTNEVVHRVKRFKHQSYAESLKDVHLPSALDLSKFDHDIADNESHFYVSLQQWRQLNLSPAFMQFAHKADPLSVSMPLLLHNWREIIQLWEIAVDFADNEALRALLDLLQKLAHDLRTTLSPVYASVLSKLLGFLPRPIATPALTSLLATLSGLFRYLLVPSIRPALLQETWSSFHAVLPSCSPEVQRAAAEVWASVLRRLKTSAREKAVQLMASNLGGVEDATAWMLVFACKSVSQTVHTASPSVIGPVIDHYLSCDSPDLLYNLLRRALTSIIHHCKGPEQFAGIADVVAARFIAVTGHPSSNDTDIERLRRVLQLTAVVCCVRQGSRLSSSHLSQLALALQTIPLHPSIDSALLIFSTSLLIAGDMSLATGVGRSFIVRALETPRFGTGFLGTLAELSWGGWKLVALPPLFKSTSSLLSQEPKGALRLLASLRRMDRLGEVDIVWRRTINDWVCKELSQWELSPEGVDQFYNLLALSTYVDRMPVLLVGIVERMLDVSHPEENWRMSHANVAWVLGACMRALVNAKREVWMEQVDLGVWTMKVAKRWSWSEGVLDGLASVLQSSTLTPEVVSFNDLYLHLQTCVLSHSRSLRLSALRLLSSRLVKSSPGEQDVLKRCLQGEEVSLDVHGVRERVLRIGRIGQVVKDDEPLAADLCTRWLLSQLKVNLRPLWSPATEALSSLAKRLGDPVWRRVFDELQGLNKSGKGSEVPDWLRESTEERVNDDPWEEERSWRDPSAHKIRTFISKWLDEKHDHKAIILEQQLSDRFDPATYESQLLATLGQCASLAEKHNRELVPYFLSMAVNDNASSSLPRYKLNAWLTLFSKFSNPKALHSTDTLLAFYRSLLSHPDRALQSIALSCLFTYKSPDLARHEETLRHLLDDNLWRDELASLDVSSIDSTERGSFVDVTIRLLFGVMLERKGRSKGGDRRVAVLNALARCSEQELSLLVDLMLKPMHSNSLAWQDGSFALVEVPSSISLKQQIGFLNLLGDVLKNLGPQITVYWPALLGNTLNIVASAHARSGVSKSAKIPVNEAGDEDKGDEAEEEGDDGDDDETDEVSTRSTRPIRQLGLRRIADFFRSPVTFDFSPYLRASFSAIISPRLPLLDQENIQAPSALMDIFYLWASRPEYVRYLVDYDERLLPKVLGCLIATNVKPTVLNLVFDIVDRLLAFSFEDSALSGAVVRPHLSLLLQNLTLLVEKTKGDQNLSSPLAQRQISILSQVAQYITDAAQGSVLLGLLSPLLRKPVKIIPEKTKVNLLTVINNLFPLVPELSDTGSAVNNKVYELLSYLFLSFRSNTSRSTLVSTFHCLAAVNRHLESVTSLLDSLNACSTKRLNEPDFDRRLAAFATLNDQQYETLSSRDWFPILYNALHFIQDPDELAIRNSAAFTIRRFIGVVSDPSTAADTEPILTRTVLPALKNALRSKSELVRAEVLGVIAHAVLKCERIDSLQEMKPLLAGGDEEASFFTNIHHIQIHRRTRALRRLGEHCDEGFLRSRTLVEIFVPLVEHYITSTASLDHLLVAEAVNTMGRIAKHLHWPAYYALVQKYLRSSKVKDDTVRVHVRVLVAILENFHFSMEEAVQDVEVVLPEDETAEREDVAPEPLLPAPQSTDVKKVSDAVNLRLLPALLGYLENRDENEDSLRIPLSLGIVKVALYLPPAMKEAQISKLLTVLSQALRSRSQETRDLVRETMCRIAMVLGPSYLSHAIRELRAALLRGPQLHVLAYVTHSLLTYVTSPERKDEAFNDLDGCIEDIAHISSEVVFGESGKDVQHEDFKTKMREVRGSASRGLDCFALSARYVSPNRISALLSPLRSVMEVTNSVKPMQQVDEVLRRIANGINANARLDPPELLVLCHTLVSQNAKFLQEAPKPQAKGKNKKDDAIVQMRRQIVSETNHYAHNSYRFVVFGLDLFTTAFRRSRFDLHDNQLLARLEPFVNLIGNTLYAESESILIAALKAVPLILQCPLKSAPSSASLVSRQVLSIIRSVGSAESELAQTAFKSLATILRECPSANVKETDLLFLLELLAPDLEEPSRQGSVFSLLRAIVARRLVVPELYDLMTTVSSILVTSQSAHTRESARALLLQFLLDYPQGSGRLQTAFTFFARNLSYEHASGRLSVLELLHALVTKLDSSLLAKHAEMLFVALVLCIANDDEKACREAAAGVVQALVKRLQDEQRKQVLGHLHVWAVQADKEKLRSVAIQVYGLLIDALQRDASPYLDMLLQDMNAITDNGRTSLLSMDNTDGTDMDVDVEWQAIYHSLQGIAKVLNVFPELTTDYAKIEWQHVIDLLLFPHTWVRSAACRLLGVLFAAQPSHPGSRSSPTSTGTTEGGISTHVAMRDVADKLCTLLKSPNLDSAMALQVVKNMFFVGKWFIAHCRIDTKDGDSLDEDNNEPEKHDEEHQKQDPLPWLFSKLSYQARSAQIARRNRASGQTNWSLSPLSVLRFFAAMTSYMNGRQLERFLPHILTPVYRITEEDTIRDSGMDELKTTATELLDLVQAKVGTTAFATTYNRIRQGALKVQQERRVARVTQATTDPEAAAKRKMARNALKKESKKRKNRAFADSRGRLKRRKEQ